MLYGHINSFNYTKPVSRSQDFYHDIHNKYFHWKVHLIKTSRNRNNFKELRKKSLLNANLMGLTCNVVSKQHSFKRALLSFVT